MNNSHNYPLIGKGMFSKVYRKSKTRVLIESVDPAKEVMALFFPSSKLFPTLERVSYGETSTYESKYYPKKSKLKSNMSDFDWEFYRWLCEYQYSTSKCNGDTDYDRLLNFFSKIPTKFHRKRDVLIEALGALTNYDLDIGFEISPRNVTAHNGRLVLLDCFYFKSKLKEVRGVL